MYSSQPRSWERRRGGGFILDVTTGVTCLTLREELCQTILRGGTLVFATRTDGYGACSGLGTTA